MAEVTRNIAKSKQDRELSQYEGGDPSWFEKVVADQKEVMGKAGLDKKY